MHADNMASTYQARPVWSWAAWLGWSGFLGFCAALFVNTLLFGRLPLTAVILGWPRSATLMMVLVTVAGWWVSYGIFLPLRPGLPILRSALIPAVPLLAGTTLPLVLIYTSDLFNHYFYYSMTYINEPKTLSLLLFLTISAVLLQLLCIKLAAGRSLGAAWENVITLTREPLTFTLLGVLGFLQVSTYQTALYADFINRYWPIADALITGVPYPVTVVAGMWPSSLTDGGLAPYLVDLPIYPVTLAISFLVFGHNMVAAYMPTVVPNIVLPMVLYLLLREIFQTRGVALSMAVAIMLFPPLRLYALNWTGPDPVFFLWFVASCWLYVRVAKGGDSRLGAPLLGLSAAAMALTRPEGIAYGSIYVLAALTPHIRRSRKIAVGTLFFAPVAAFSLFMLVTFQMPWPRNWTGSMDAKNIAGNWDYLSRASIDLAAQAMGFSPEEFLTLAALFLLTSLIGTLYLLRREWRVAILFAPAWLNLAVVFTIDPRVSGAYQWDDFFRHISYPLPLLAIAAGVASEAGVRAVPRRFMRPAAAVALNLLLFWIILWNINLLAKPAFGYGAGAGNMLGTAKRLNVTDLVAHHPFDLPNLQFGVSSGHWATTSWGETVWTYPNFLRQFFAQFDTVGQATGVAYETGSQFVYFALLALAMVPSAEPVRDSRAGAVQ